MMTNANRDTTFTKGLLLALIGAIMVILYVVPSVLLALGLTLLVGGLVLIGISILRLRRRFRAPSAWRS